MTWCHIITQSGAYLLSAEIFHLKRLFENESRKFNVQWALYLINPNPFLTRIMMTHFHIIGNDVVLLMGKLYELYFIFKNKTNQYSFLDMVIL